MSFADVHEENHDSGKPVGFAAPGIRLQCRGNVVVGYESFRLTTQAQLPLILKVTT